MAVKFNKKNKEVTAHTSKPGKMCTLTLIFEIIISISLGLVGLSPILSGAFGVFLFLLLGAVMIVITLISACLVWTVEGIRVFFFGDSKAGKTGAFGIIGKLMESPEKIVTALKPYIVLISLVMFAVAALGFVWNLIYFIRHEKSNKGRFITSCIFLGLAIINLVMTLIIFFTFKL